jgi:hypothetical protein
MPKYNPNSISDRQSLAMAVEFKLQTCGFTPEPSTNDRFELIYKRPVGESKISVVVYTSIVNDQVRNRAKDAIRIAGVYENGDVRRGIVSDTRVNRVGEIPDIVERMYQRMRECYRSCNTARTCDKCGAPMFTSKKKNLVCAEACWAKNR